MNENLIFVAVIESSRGYLLNFEDLLLDKSKLSIASRHSLNLRAYCNISLLFSQLAFKTHDSPITDKRINPMIARAKAPQLHLLSILYLFRVAISPFHWHLRVRICVDQDIECAVAGIELWKECHRGCDLAKD